MFTWWRYLVIVLLVKIGVYDLRLLVFSFVWYFTVLYVLVALFVLGFGYFAGVLVC